MESQEGSSQKEVNNFDGPNSNSNPLKRYTTDPGIPFHLLKRQRVSNGKKFMI